MRKDRVHRNRPQKDLFWK